MQWGADTNIVITEIMYNPPSGFADEWIEIYNKSSDSINIKSWQFYDSDEYDEYILSVHGSEIKKNNDVPRCYSCHGKHNILNSESEMSRTYSINASEV